MSRRFACARGASLGALLLLACSVDDRVLEPAEPPPLIVTSDTAGAGAAGDANDMNSASDAGGASALGDEPSGETSAQGGQGGASPDSPPPSTSFPVTTVTSWTFDNESELGDWELEEGVSEGFSSDDADGSADSGSLLVTDAAVDESDDFVSAAAFVCVPVEGGATYAVAAELAIDAGQSAGSGGFNVQSFDGPSCDGGLLDLVNYLTPATGDWHLGERTLTASPGARSALLRLVVSKRASDPPFAVRFDDVRFEAE